MSVHSVPELRLKGKTVCTNFRTETYNTVVLLRKQNTLALTASCLLFGEGSSSSSISFTVFPSRVLWRQEWSRAQKPSEECSGQRNVLRWSPTTDPDDHNSQVPSTVRDGDSVLLRAPCKDAAWERTPWRSPRIRFALTAPPAGLFKHLPVGSWFDFWPDFDCRCRGHSWHRVPPLAQPHGCPAYW